MGDHQLVVVALPDENDSVRKYSSEKEPHLTLLYLGQPELSPEDFVHVAQYLEHVAKFLCKFGLDVESRGPLGDKPADVLFFNKNYTKSVSEFRENLLKDPIISRAYLSTDQFPEWTPHLTMGYPDAPAKEDDRDRPGFFHVSFDRIALWTGDYEGLTYPLKSLPHYDLEVAMSQTADRGREALMHYGVKGMRWGVRNSDSSGGISRKTARADKKFEKQTRSAKTMIKVYNNAVVHANKYDVDRINNKAKYKDKDFSLPSKLRDEYYKEHQDAFNNALEKSARDLGTNASGTRRLGVYIDKNGGWQVVTKEIKHADDEVVAELILKFDERGYIISFELEEPRELKHYGVKGMKWGVTNASRPSGSSASDDHKEAVAAQRKIQRSGTKALSNKELQSLITRKNLEKQYHTMTQEKAVLDKGNDRVVKLLKYGKTYNDVIQFLNTTPAGQKVKMGFKIAGVAAKVGAAYATGGTSAAATTAGTIVVRRAANHYTNVGR